MTFIESMAAALIGAVIGWLVFGWPLGFFMGGATASLLLVLAVVGVRLFGGRE